MYYIVYIEIQFFYLFENKLWPWKGPFEIELWWKFGAGTHAWIEFVIFPNIDWINTAATLI